MIERLLPRLARALTKHKIPYMVIGGQAVLFYGRPRLTQDVDITLGVDIDAYETIKAVCRDARLKLLPRDPLTFVAKTRALPTQDSQSGLRVDFIFSNSRYERKAVVRARVARIGRVKIRMISLEDLIIHKLVAGRAVDLEDIRVLLAKHRKIQIRYVRHWLNEFSKLGALEENPLVVFDRLRQQKETSAG